MSASERSVLAMHLFNAPMVTESRYLKVTRSLRSAEIVTETEVFGLWREGLARLERPEPWRTVVRQRVFNDLPWVRRWRARSRVFGKIATMCSVVQRHLGCAVRLLRREPQLVLIHNPELLPVGVLVSRVLGAGVMYVPHELETGRAGLRLAWLVRAVEALFVPWTDHVVVVSPAIGERYAQRFPRTPIDSVRNVPVNPRRGRELESRRALRAELGVPSSALLFIYQGLIDNFRDVPGLLTTFTQQDSHHILFMGFGSGVPAVEDAAARFRTIHYLPPVAMEDIIGVTAGADIGLLLAPEPCSESYRLTTANKLFEYAIAGVPIVISANFEYMSGLVHEQRLGWVIPPGPAALAEFVTAVTPEAVSASREELEAFSRTVDWHGEVVPLLVAAKRLVPPQSL